MMSNDMENKIFPCGRHRNKTYQQVFASDKDFCTMVLKGERSKFIPEDFREYLLSKTIRISIGRHVIKERSCPHFVKALPPDGVSELRDLLHGVQIKLRQVHAPCRVMRPNGYLGVFHHFFIKKCVFNIVDMDATCKYLTKYATIFPFKISPEISQCNAEILEYFDDDVLHEIQVFLNDHFDDVIVGVVDIFFANIINFRCKNFTEFALSKTLKNMNLKGFSMLDDENNYTEQNGNLYDKFNKNGERCEYLKNFPRVNSAGAKRYKEMYNVVADVYNFFQKPFNVLPYKYEPKYLTKLPEINFYELYSLLNPEFLKRDRREYMYRFKKYLFFFLHALQSQSESKPVFFIDDVLFECLQSLHKFKKSRQNVFDLKFDLAMMTVVYRRKQPSEFAAYDVDDENLHHVQDYIRNFPDVSKALIDFEVNTSILETTALMCTPDTCIDACFRTKSRKKISDFFELAIHGALSPKNIKRLVIYNAYTGEESSIEMPSNKEEFVNFVQTHNKYDFSETLPAEKFITWGHEKFYQHL